MNTWGNHAITSGNSKTHSLRATSRGPKGLPDPLSPVPVQRCCRCFRPRRSATWTRSPFPLRAKMYPLQPLLLKRGWKIPYQWRFEWGKINKCDIYFPSPCLITKGTFENLQKGARTWTWHIFQQHIHALHEKVTHLIQSLTLVWCFTQSKNATNTTYLFVLGKDMPQSTVYSHMFFDRKWVASPRVYQKMKHIRG